MSNEELEAIRGHGLSAIINVCAEYCDLLEIWAARGFEVHYLPVVDENVPPEQELNGSLAKGKKVLVRCRFGIGRTGTFVTVYLLGKGYRGREIKRLLKACKAGATSPAQRRPLRRLEKLR
jgi:hypothetical protein